jgi:hypothetical protein
MLGRRARPVLRGAGRRKALRLPERGCGPTRQGLWSNLKAVELGNLTSPTLAEVIDQAHRGIERVRRTPHLAYSFLRHAGLSVS